MSCAYPQTTIWTDPISSLSPLKKKKKLRQGTDKIFRAVELLCVFL